MDILKIVSDLTITEKTKQNIIRKSDFVDLVRFDTTSQLPLFSWLDISLTELCNRVCEFCPRAIESFYPNQNLHFSLELEHKISAQLRSIDYSGGIVFCGYGEPLLHPQICEIVHAFQGMHVEIVTNGDRLTREIITNLYDAGLSFLCISMYDGPEQINYFNDLMKSAQISDENFILRDRWHKEVDSFGLKLTNRSGVLHFGPSPSSYANKPCYYPSYSMAIDWNGDVLLCVQDWNKKIKFGNLNSEDLLSAWKSLRFHKYRSKLIESDRSLSPCRNCNADGTLHGFNHANEWTRIQNAS